MRSRFCSCIIRRYEARTLWCITSHQRTRWAGPLRTRRASRWIECRISCLSRSYESSWLTWRCGSSHLSRCYGNTSLWWNILLTNNADLSKAKTILLCLELITLHKKVRCLELITNLPYILMFDGSTSNCLLQISWILSMKTHNEIFDRIRKRFCICLIWNEFHMEVIDILGVNWYSHQMACSPRNRNRLMWAYQLYKIISGIYWIRMTAGNLNWS